MDDCKKLALSPAEASEALGVGRHTVYALCQREDFPAVRVGGRIIIPVAALRRWLEQQTEGGGNIG